MRQVEEMHIHFWHWPPNDGIPAKAMRKLPAEWAKRQMERMLIVDNRVNLGAPALAFLKGDIVGLSEWVRGLQAYREELDHEVAELTEWLTGYTADGTPVPTGKENMRRALADLRRRLDRLEAKLDPPSDGIPPKAKRKLPGKLPEWAERQIERMRMIDNRVGLGGPALAFLKSDIVDLRNWVQGLQAYREELDYEVAELTEWLTGYTADGTPVPTGKENMRRTLADLRRRLDRLEAKLDPPREENHTLP